MKIEFTKEELKEIRFALCNHIEKVDEVISPLSQGAFDVNGGDLKERQIKYYNITKSALEKVNEVLLRHKP